MILNKEVIPQYVNALVDLTSETSKVHNRVFVYTSLGVFSYIGMSLTECLFDLYLTKVGAFLIFSWEFEN